MSDFNDKVLLAVVILVEDRTIVVILSREPLDEMLAFVMRLIPAKDEEVVSPERWCLYWCVHYYSSGCSCFEVKLLDLTILVFESEAVFKQLKRLFFVKWQRFKDS